MPSCISIIVEEGRPSLETDRGIYQKWWRRIETERNPQTSEEQQARGMEV
jgi:hypothetical protein